MTPIAPASAARITSPGLFHETRTSGTAGVVAMAVSIAVISVKPMGPCCVSTVSESQP